MNQMNFLEPVNPPRRILLLGALAYYFADASHAQAVDSPIPKHIVLARLLVEHVQPENNKYRLGAQQITLPSDASPGPYSVTADCSGFLLALFARTGGPAARQFDILRLTPGRKRPRAEDFVESIERQLAFQQLHRVTDLRPGDLLAHAMLKAEDRAKTGTTGHVFLINSEPMIIEARPPVVQGTRQFLVSIIDSNEEWVGSDDTRLANPKLPIKGLGRGSIRLYADQHGALVGWARTFSKAHRFFSYDPRFPSENVLRKAAMGRPHLPS